MGNILNALDGKDQAARSSKRSQQGQVNEAEPQSGAEVPLSIEEKDGDKRFFVRVSPEVDAMWDEIQALCIENSNNATLFVQIVIALRIALQEQGDPRFATRQITIMPRISERRTL